MIKEALAAFQGSYLAGFDKLYPEPALFALAARLFDLQRTAVLITMQKGEGHDGAPEDADRTGGGGLAILWPTDVRCLCWKWKSGGSSCNSPANCPDNRSRGGSPVLALGVAGVCNPALTSRARRPAERCRA